MYIDLSKMNSGFCDRLRQITFCLAFNKLSKKKLKIVEIYEIKNRECPYFFSELLKINKCIVKNVKKKNINTIKMTPFDSSLSIDTCKKYNNNKSISNSKLLDEWKKSYKLLIPKNKIKSKIKKLKKKGKYISIHLRLTDKLVSYFEFFFEIPKKDIILKSQINMFINELENLIPKKCKNIYLASDEGFYKKKIEKSLSKKFNLINHNIHYHSKKLRQTSGENFIFDLFAMANSDYIISSTGGNVPFTSLLISKKKIKYLKWINLKFSFKFLNFVRNCLYAARSIIGSLRS